jgi:hypothetical protein
VALGLDEGAGIGVDPEDPPGPRREVEGEAPGPGADVEKGAAVERFLVEPRDQSRRQGAVTLAVSRRAPARLLDVPSHAGASRPSILRREKLP